MLGQPVAMVIPEVIGFRLKGRLKEGITATDLVLTCTQMLRKRGVVEKFVEFFGDGLDHLSLEDRATIANMAPEYGATCGFFPIDADTIKYLTATGRKPERVALVEAYAKAQGMWREPGTSRCSPTSSSSTSRPSSRRWPAPSGRRIAFRSKDAKAGFAKSLPDIVKGATLGQEDQGRAARTTSIGNGDVVIAAITSCTNTSNPSVLIAAGLVARNARAKGLKVKPWVKTVVRAGLAGRHRLHDQGRPAGRPRRAWAST